MLIYLAAILASVVFLYCNSQGANENNTDLKFIPRHVQNWYIHNITDTVPPLESINDCDCPRIYIPVCGSDNRSYTNLCYMNCLNSVLQKPKPVRLYYMGPFFSTLILISTVTAVLGFLWSTTRKYEKALPSLFGFMACEKCPNVYFPVCTTLNKTFMNVCLFNCLNITGHNVTYRGICMIY